MIIYNNIIPFKGFIAMNLFGLIFARKRLKTKSEFYRSVVIRHERIHTKQYIETLFIGFLLIYGLEYLIKLIITRSTRRTYKSISLEQEAYTFQLDDLYLKQRKHYFWFRYIFRIV